MKFLKTVLASCLGVFLAFVAIAVIGSISIAGLASSFNTDPVISDNSILKLSLKTASPEKTNNVEFEYQDFTSDDVIGLHDIIASITAAKEDNNIDALYLDLLEVNLGMSAASDIRTALLDFKDSGKPIYAYSDYLTQKSYLLAATADTLALNPNGIIEMRGFGIMIPFFKDLLDNLGVKMQVFYAGDFKSATEPFRYNKMSKYNREQTKAYINDLYSTYIDELTESREIESKTIKELSANDVFINPDKAIETRLIDLAIYQDQMYDIVRDRFNLAEDKKIKFTTVEDYNKARKKSDFSIKDKIAVIYAEGSIVYGEDVNGKITQTKYTDVLRKVRKDKKIKAVVLRVNSGGGDALVSDNIWRETILLKESGKPFIASFGDVAASGGYYISAAADKIYANSNSITGSIGAFGMLPEAEELINDKLKIHFDTVNTAAHATAYTPYFKLTDEQFGYLQENIDKLYDKFTRKVAEGRGMELAKVKEIARGRVYSGTQAKEIGLVDNIGNLSDAISEAAKLANLEKYRVVEYPKFKNPVDQLIQDLLGGDKAKTMVQSKLEKEIPGYKTLQEIKLLERPQYRMPYQLVID